MKMHDLGARLDEADLGAAPAKDRKYYPSLYLSQKQIKALGFDSAHVGQETDVVIKVRVRSVSQNVDGDRTVDLEIIEAGVPEGPSRDYAKAMYPTEG